MLQPKASISAALGDAPAAEAYQTVQERERWIRSGAAAINAAKIPPARQCQGQVRPDIAFVRIDRARSMGAGFEVERRSNFLPEEAIDSGSRLGLPL
jgi:hypothetical protein